MTIPNLIRGIMWNIWGNYGWTEELHPMLNKKQLVTQWFNIVKLFPQPDIDQLPYILHLKFKKLWKSKSQDGDHNHTIETPSFFDECPSAFNCWLFWHCSPRCLDFFRSEKCLSNQGKFHSSVYMFNFIILMSKAICSPTMLGSCSAVLLVNVDLPLYSVHFLRDGWVSIYCFSFWLHSQTTPVLQWL